MGIFSFVPAPIPPGDYDRSRAARSSVLMTARADVRLTGLTNSARQLFGCRWSGLCVIADDFQHVVASSGGMLGTYRRATALTSYVVAYPDEPMCLLDASVDERFAGNPFVDDGLIRFFAAAPVWQEGFVLGALCVTDPNPRTSVDETQMNGLRRLAGAVLPETLPATHSRQDC